LAAQPVTRIEEALSLCGVTGSSLPDHEGHLLDTQGFLVKAGLASPQELRRQRAAFEKVAAERGAAGSSTLSGTRHLEHLAYSDPAFDSAYTHPMILAAVFHVLKRSFKVFQLSGRDPLPGHGLQGLHQDWLPRMPSEPFSIVTALWLLDDFTPDNGATRVVPGSHHVLRPLPKSQRQPGSTHPEQRLILARAGSVLLFNGHLWHSGTRNASTGSRRVLQCQFVARELVRPGEPGPEVPSRLPPAARYLLGV